jgi:protein O-mannosyl-transferase
VLGQLAWLLATVKDDKLRDGAEAVRLAEEVCRQTERKVPALLDVLAAAYAEAGRFDDAAQTAAEAQRLAAEQGNSQLAATIGERVELFKNGRHFRQP